MPLWGGNDIVSKIKQTGHFVPSYYESHLPLIIVKKLNSLKHLVRMTVAESHN